MTNARQEFLEHIKGNIVMCVKLWQESFLGDVGDVYLLKVGFSEKEYQDFLSRIDFDYDSEYGSQSLYGNIWYLDGTYSGRDEYDGSEWWEHYKTPEIPEELK